MSGEPVAWIKPDWQNPEVYDGTSPVTVYPRADWTPLYTRPDELIEALREIMRFHKGEGEYNFVSLSSFDRSNAIDDAWYSIRAKIEAALAKWGER